MEKDHQSAPQPSAAKQDEPLIENSKSHLPSDTQGDNVQSTTEDIESLTTGEHDTIEIVPRLTSCC